MTPFHAIHKSVTHIIGILKRLCREISFKNQFVAHLKERGVLNMWYGSPRSPRSPHIIGVSEMLCRETLNKNQFSSHIFQRVCTGQV